MVVLHLADKLLLLALDDEKGNFVTQPFALSYGLSGAILLELSLKECIKIVDSKVIVNVRKKLDDVLLNSYLQVLASSKRERTLQYWVRQFGGKEKEIKEAIIEKLITHKIVVKRAQKILWIFNNDVFPTVNAKPEKRLRKRLYEIIEYSKKATIDELMLMGLIDSCKLNTSVYGKERTKRYKSRIKAIIADIQHEEAIGETVKEVHQLIVSMLAVIISTSVAATVVNTN